MTKFEMLRVFDTSTRGMPSDTSSFPERALGWLGLDRELVEAIAGDLTERSSGARATRRTRKKTHTKVIIDANTGAVLSSKQFGGLRGVAGWVRESAKRK